MTKQILGGEKLITPCFNCSFRHAKCHAVCEVYAKFRNECDERIMERARQCPTRDYTVESFFKAKKRAQRSNK